MVTSRERSEQLSLSLSLYLYISSFATHKNIYVAPFTTTLRSNKFYTTVSMLSSQAL